MLGGNNHNRRLLGQQPMTMQMNKAVMIAAACLMLLSVVFSESLCMPTVVGSLLLQLGIPLLILAQVHWVAQELYLHRP
jgi:ACR3 family arsenite efflux pump ArsB